VKPPSQPWRRLGSRWLLLPEENLDEIHLHADHRGLVDGAEDSGKSRRGSVLIG
jgi:hypothetical protein